VYVHFTTAERRATMLTTAERRATMLTTAERRVTMLTTAERRATMLTTAERRVTVFSLCDSSRDSLKVVDSPPCHCGRCSVANTRIDRRYVLNDRRTRSAKTTPCDLVAC